MWRQRASCLEGEGDGFVVVSEWSADGTDHDFRFAFIPGRPPYRPAQGASSDQNIPGHVFDHEAHRMKRCDGDIIVH